MNNNKKFIFFPLYILLLLIVISNTLGITGGDDLIRPNTLLIVGTILVVFGLVVGVTATIYIKAIRMTWKICFLLLYIPIVIFSFLIIGL